MPILQLMPGIIIGLISFSSFTSLLLWRKGIERRINLEYFFFSAFIIAYIAFGWANFKTSDVAEFARNQIILNSSILMAAAAFILLLSDLTGRRSRKEIIFLLGVIGLLFIINLQFKFGFTYIYVERMQPEISSLGENIYVPVGRLSPAMWLIMGFTVIVGIYVHKCILYQYRQGKKKESRILLASILFGLMGLIVHNVALLFHIRITPRLDHITLVMFTMIVVYRNFQSILEAGKVKQELINSEARYSAIVNNALDGILIHENGVIKFANKSLLNLVGYKNEEDFMGTHIMNHIAEEDREKVLDYTKRRIMDQEAPDSYEMKLITFDGKYVDVEITAATFEYNNSISTIGIIRDITIRKLVENAVNRGMHNFQLLFETAPYACLITEAEYPNRIIEANAAYFRLSKKTRDEVIGTSSNELIDENTRMEMLNEYQKKNKVENFEVRAYNSLGEEKFFLLNMNLINFDEKPAAFVVLEDITQQRAAKAELQNAMKFIEYVINSIPAMIISINQDFDVTLHNAAAEKYINPAEQGHSGKIFSKFPTFSFIKDLLEKSLDEKIQVFENKMVSDDHGNVKNFTVAISPLHSDNNPGFVIMIEDVTDKRMMEALMIQSEKMLSVAGLAAGMAHELNNPLGTIVQGCQNIIRRTSSVLQKNHDTAESLGINISQIEEYFKERQIYDIIDSVRNAATKASEIIRNMLSFSRRSESKRVSASITEIIDSVLELAVNDYDLKKKYDFRSIAIEKNYEEGIPDIRVTVTEIEQVFFNVLRNAAQAFKEENDKAKKPVIRFRVLRENKYLRIDIEDNGPGIPEKIKGRIFEPFFTTKEVGEGTGLGLSVSYMIVTTNHGGIITVESQLGRGSIFTIKLPL